MAVELALPDRGYVPDPNQYYRVLGLSLPHGGAPASLTSSQIRRAYHDLARQVHPDSGQFDQSRWDRIQVAAECLLDPAERARYDRLQSHQRRIDRLTDLTSSASIEKLPDPEPEELPRGYAYYIDEGTVIPPYATVLEWLRLLADAYRLVGLPDRYVRLGFGAPRVDSRAWGRVLVIHPQWTPNSSIATASACMLR